MSFPTVIRAAPGTQYGIYSSAQHPLGQRMELDDGRKFRYVLVGASDLVVGDLVQGKALVAGDYTDVPIDATSAIGDTTISVTPTTTTAKDYYAGGWMHVNKAAVATAAGTVYRVKSHVLFAVAAGKIITLEPDDSIRVALAAADEIGLTPNPYNGVIQAPITTLTNRLVGVAVKNTTAAKYGWVQTGGVAAVNSAASQVVGNIVTDVLAAAGRVGVAITGAGATDANVKEAVGIVLSVPTTAGEFGSVFLTLD